MDTAGLHAVVARRVLFWEPLFSAIVGAGTFTRVMGWLFLQYHLLAPEGGSLDSPAWVALGSEVGGGVGGWKESRLLATQQAGGEAVWLGGSDWAAEGDWRWETGEPIGQGMLGRR